MTGGDSKKEYVWKPWREADHKPAAFRSPESISAMLPVLKKKYPALLAALTDREANDLHRIRENWKQFAGPLSEHSEPVEIQDETLKIQAAKPVYAQEISLHSRSIIRMIQKSGIQIKSLKVRA